MQNDVDQTSNELRCSLAMVFTKDLGVASYRKLLSKFHSSENIFKASAKDIAATENIGAAKAERIKSFSSWDLVDREIKKAESKGVSIIHFLHPEYPDQLRNFDDAPVVIYMKGKITADDANSIAVVRSRLMSEYGRRAAQDISRGLAQAGLTVISGMARGIDTIAHESALGAGGRTIAVLGSGLDVIYPSENRKLFNKITESGAVISEFPFDTGPLKENFPRRNRLISGLSLGVLVVEAAPGSGSLITASYALEQGKEIFAVPGNIGQKNSEGTNRLINSGAKLVLSVNDIIEELAPKIKKQLSLTCLKNKADITSRIEALEITGDEKAICTVLASGSRHIDQILRQLNITPSKLSGILLNLELKGLVRQLEGKKFEIV
ncbi:MAG: DNA-processing protein DprA [Nitrospirae bacterium]|nr:DNA-processing protein DprA [Nitrospirota bacterium]